ncbi:MAG: hypothetical protein PHC41_14610 [Lachnospiraceae bacterium]|nr:hypothetical protein [Lachnospiraceae bacterium]MDD3617438.1 hypothetical protein [Lachnospiraceae bacterium]
MKVNKILAIFTAIFLALSIGGTIYFTLEEKKAEQSELEHAQAQNYIYEQMEEDVKKTNEEDLIIEGNEVITQEDWDYYTSGEIDKVSPEALKRIQEIMSLE